VICLPLRRAQGHFLLTSDEFADPRPRPVGKAASGEDGYVRACDLGQQGDQRRCLAMLPASAACATITAGDTIFLGYRNFWLPTLFLPPPGQDSMLW